MKISIDTAQDSVEQIRKAIRLLQQLVEHDASQGSRNIFDSPGADLFGSAPAASAQPSQSPATAFGSLFSDDKPATPPAPEEKKETGEIPRIELY